MNRWNAGDISDAHLMREMEEYIFSASGKGETLKAYLLIAMG